MYASKRATGEQYPSARSLPALTDSLRFPSVNRTRTKAVVRPALLALALCDRAIGRATDRAIGMAGWRGRELTTVLN